MRQQSVKTGQQIGLSTYCKRATRPCTLLQHQSVKTGRQRGHAVELCWEFPKVGVVCAVVARNTILNREYEKMSESDCERKGKTHLVER